MANRNYYTPSMIRLIINSLLNSNVTLKFTRGNSVIWQHANFYVFCTESP